MIVCFCWCRFVVCSCMCKVCCNCCVGVFVWLIFWLLLCVCVCCRLILFMWWCVVFIWCCMCDWVIICLNGWNRCWLRVSWLSVGCMRFVLC